MNLIRTFIFGVVPCLIVVIVNQGSKCFYSVLVALTVWGAIMANITLTGIFCRRFTKTIMSAIIFAYLGSFVYGMISVAIGLCMMGINQRLIGGWMAAIATALTMLLTILLFIIGRRNALKGYRSGFENRDSVN